MHGLEVEAAGSSGGLQVEAAAIRDLVLGSRQHNGGLEVEAVVHGGLGMEPAAVRGGSEVEPAAVEDCLRWR